MSSCLSLSFSTIAFGLIDILPTSPQTVILNFIFKLLPDYSPSLHN